MAKFAAELAPSETPPPAYCQVDMQFDADPEAQRPLMGEQPGPDDAAIEVLMRHHALPYKMIVRGISEVLLMIVRSLCQVFKVFLIGLFEIITTLMKLVTSVAFLMFLGVVALIVAFIFGLLATMKLIYGA